MNNKKPMPTGRQENLKIIFKNLKKSVDPAIDKILVSSVFKNHHDIIKYQIKIGGKRLRPILAMLSCQMMGGKIKDVLYPAASLEILHNYTLIVDDIIDHSDFRRRKPTVWKKYGKSPAELISMNYAASIFDIPENVKNKEKIIKILAKTLKSITDGQILDVLFEQNGREDEVYIIKNRYVNINIRDYNKLISSKTASLFRACLEIGGICANARQGAINKLKNFGFNLGLAFQVQDDILDMFGDEKKFGKKIGKDIEERKLGNIIILLAMEEFSLKNKKAFLNILRKKKISNKDIKEGISLIKKTKALEKAYKLEMKYIKKAKQSLERLPNNKWNKVLENLTDYLVKRKV